MQALLASLVFAMSVKDDAFKVGMAQARAEAKKTGQDFDRTGRGMTEAIQSAAREVNAAAILMADGLADVGRKVQQAGLALTAGLTVPLGLVGKSAKDTASDFQSAMGRVNSAIVDASPEQLEKLRAAALDLGPAFGKSAIEAAAAIEALAKNGMSAADILSGGLKSALTLAVTGQADLASAADLTTDIMSQFGKSTDDLPRTVDRVVGALDASKMGFDDFRLAAGQAGGVAGSLGYSFEDFNTALAATAPLFDSGSSAGTSFRAFLTALAGKSEDARKVMAKLGLELYNTDGSAKSLAAIAEQLQMKMGGLSDRAKSVALDKMFGADGGQTAVALIKLGAKGINDVAAAIDKVAADQKMKILLEGEAAATQRLASAWEKLKIVIGEAGLVQFFTMVKDAAASFVDAIASVPPWFMKLVVVSGLVAASIGPLVLSVTALAKFALPLLLLRLGPVALGLATIINPVGVLIRLLGELALRFGAMSIIGALGSTLLRFAGPIGIVVTVLSMLVPLLFRSAQASSAAKAAQDAANDANAKAADTANQLATATGRARQEILAKAKADRVAAVAAVGKAKADLIAARAELARADAATPGRGVGLIARSLVDPMATGRAAAASNARNDLAARVNTTNKAVETLNLLDQAIKQAEASTDKPNLDMSFEDAKKAKKGRDAGRDVGRDDAAYQDELGRLRVSELQARADLTGAVVARYRADMAALDEERASFIRQNVENEGLTTAKRATLLAEKDRELFVRRAVIEQARSIGFAEEGHALAAAANDAQQEAVRAGIDLARSAGERRIGELRLLDLQRQQEDADLDLILATKATSSAEWDNARRRKEQLDARYGERRAAAMRNTEGPGESFLRDLGRGPQAIAEDIESLGVSAVRDLNSGLAEAVMNTKKLGDAFTSMGKRIIQSLIEIAIQQAIVAPLANALFGGFGGLGSGTGGSGVGKSNWLAGGSGSNGFFGGFRAAGGPVSASNWYVVGERGPEVFAPGVSGTIIPNGGRGGGASGGVTLHQTIQFAGAVDIADKAYVRDMANRAGQSAVSAVREMNRRRAG